MNWFITTGLGSKLIAKVIPTNGEIVNEGLNATRIVRESDYSPAAVPCMQCALHAVKGQSFSKY